jgi:hypothetical protein
MEFGDEAWGGERAGHSGVKAPGSQYGTARARGIENEAHQPKVPRDGMRLPLIPLVAQTCVSRQEFLLSSAVWVPPPSPME